MKQVRASIPSHLHSVFFEVGRQLNTDDPTIINTHILSCYFTGGCLWHSKADRSENPKLTTPKESDSYGLADLDDLNDWSEETVGV